MATIRHNMATCARVLLLLLLLSGSGVLCGQTTATTMDTDFWVGFLKNFDDNSPFGDTLSLLVSGSTSTTGTATCDTMSINFSVTPGTTTHVVLPNDFPTATFGVHVTTAEPVSLYASHYQHYSHDITGVLPSSTIGNDYVLQSYQDTSASPLEPKNNEFCVVATQDSTTVYYQIGDNSSAMTDSVLLHAGQVFKWIMNTPLSGTHVWTTDCDKPIAVFMGHECAFIPFNEAACDHLYEQAIPTRYWGRNFVVTSSLLRDHDIVRVTALYDSTTFTFGSATQTLEARQTTEFDIQSKTTPATFLESDKPVSVILYLTGNMYTDNPFDYSMLGRADPAMVVVHPVEQQIRQATFTSFHYLYRNYHHVNITINSSSINDIVLDGVPIGDEFIRVPNHPEYAYARLTIVEGSHTLSSPNGGFNAYTYGYGTEESYDYALGTSFNIGRPQLSIADIQSAQIDSTNNNFCQDDTLHFSITSNADITSIVWDFGDGQTAMGAHVGVVYSTPGDHLVTAVVTSSIHCLPERVDTLTLPIHIIPIFYEVTDTVVCGDSCLWHGNTYTDTGLYSLHTIENLNCGLMELHLLNIYPHPTTSIEESRDCDSHRIVLTAQSSGDRYTWASVPIDPDLSEHEHDTVISITPREGQTYTLWTSYSYDSLCSSTATFLNHEITSVVAHAKAYPLIADENHPIITLSDFSSGSSDRCWYVDGTMQGTDPVTYINYDYSRDSMCVMLVVSDGFGCNDTDFVTLYSNIAGIWAPNIFTPTEQTNSHFRLFGTNIKHFEIWIFNRQGILVWHSTDFNKEWDGTCHGHPCEQGAYAYTVTYTTCYEPKSIKRLTGTVTLVR